MTPELVRIIGWVVAELDSGRKPSRDFLKTALPWESMPRRHRLIYLAQLGLCSICRQEIPLKCERWDEEAVSRDHVQAKFFGGNHYRNILLAHRSCNSDRGYEEPTPELIRLAPAFQPRIDLRP